MNSSLENTTSIRQPRTRQAPSPRNQQIYLDYQTGQRQIDLAQKYNLTQCRISQIIRRVEKWLHSPASESPQSVGWAVPTAARDRLQHRVQYDRLNEAGRLALQHFHQQQKIVTHKKGARAGKKFHETTERLLPPSLQCLKVVVQSSAQLTRLQSSRHTPCAVGSPRACASPKANHSGEPPTGSPSPTATPPDAPLSREHVEAWLTDHHDQAARHGKVVTDLCPDAVIRDVVKALLGEPSTGLALHTLARDAGQKVVKRQPYEEKSPPIPNRDGWYYGMHDENGGLVAWLHADQLAHAISPDYPPVSRSAPNPSTPTRSVSEGSSTTTNSTSPSTTNSPQPTSSPALTALSPQTEFHAQYEPQPFDLQSIQPAFHQKGCHN